MMSLKYLLITGLLSSCVAKTDFNDTDHPGGNGSPQVVSVAYLKTLYRNYPVLVKEEMDIHAVVTGNDCYKALRNTLVVQDKTGGIELKVSGESLFVTFPIGQEVWVHVQGLALGSYSGVVSLGTPSKDAAYENSFIPQAELPQYIKQKGSATDIRPDTLVFSDLNATWVSRYVAFEEVQFTDEEHLQTWCDTDLDTDRHLVNRAGDTLSVRTSHWADFAYTPLPTGSGYIEGILSWFNRSYQLKVISPKGVVMESPRFTPKTDQ